MDDVNEIKVTECSVKAFYEFLRIGDYNLKYFKRPLHKSTCFSAERSKQGWAPDF